MSTVYQLKHRRPLQIGPTDHGLELSYKDFASAEFEEGHKYEIIDGRVYVSPIANFSDYWYEQFIHQKLTAWASRHPKKIGFVAMKSRVFVKKRAKATAPEPDVAAFIEKPLGPKTNWRDLSPLIVVEVMRETLTKDLVRNVELYREIPSILEYWVIDIRKNESDPTLIVFRRDSGDENWTTTEYAADAVYKTPLLPGFKMPVTPKW